MVHKSVSGIILKHDIKCNKNNITQSLQHKHLFICSSKSLNLNCNYFQHKYLESSLAKNTSHTMFNSWRSISRGMLNSLLLMPLKRGETEKLELIVEK